MASPVVSLPARLDHDETLVLPMLLRQRAQTNPTQVFLKHTDGTELTYEQLERRVRLWMHTLTEAGVRPGDRVMTLLPPSFDAVAVWMATSRLKAIETPANTALKGEFLAHVTADCDPACIVTENDYVSVLDELPTAESLPTVLVTNPKQPVPATSTVTVTTPVFDIEYAGDDYIPRPCDIATMVYTSGTSGRSKGVIVPWAQEYATARWLMPIDGRHGDVWYGPWAMFHVSGKVGLYSAAILDGQLVIRNGFSTSNFWSDVRRFNVTSTMLVASTVSFLIQQEPHTDDRDHTLRNVCAAPLPPDTDAFCNRFGVRLSTLFNMTETASPISTGWANVPPGSCGKARPGIQARVVDENGNDVPIGDTGELVLRSTVPHEIMAGYWRAPQATLDAWRDLWFHTGDAVRVDNDGNYYFLDRMKDTIRRGGENISSAELEAAVDSHPLVAESAAVGIPTAWGDKDVKLFIVPKTGFDATELAKHLDNTLPRYMRPSVISVLDALPKTHTARVKKAELRKLHDNDPAWVRPISKTLDHESPERQQ